MKKITLLILLMTLPFVGIAQTFDFTNTDDGWSILGGFNAATGATFYTLTTKDGNGTLKNPTVAIAAAGVDTTVESVVGITMRNNDVTGPDFMRVSYLKPAGGRVYKNSDISTGDTGFVTYWFDLSNANWSGTMDDIKLHFRSAGNTDYFLPNAGSNISIDIDKIVFAASIPTTLQESYTFNINGDTEGFSATAGSVTGPTSGILTFTPVAAQFAKLNQLIHHVDATTNKYIHITLKNNSALNDQLRFVFPKAGGGNSTTTQPMTVSDTGDKTYEFDMTGNADWTGNLVFTVGIGSLADGKSKDTGTVEFNSIDINSTLSVNDVDFRDDARITLFPNPVTDVFRVDSPLAIEKIEVFNLLGQKSMTVESNTVDASALGKGMYIIKVTQENDIISTKRFIKQ